MDFKILFLQFGLYDLNHKIIADYVFVIYLFLNKVKFVHYNRFISKYLVGGFSEINENQQLYDRLKFHNKMLLHSNNISIAISIIRYKFTNKIKKIIKKFIFKITQS